MPCFVVLFGSADEAMIVREAYGTIKKRLLDARDFVEVSVDTSKKMVLNKGGIMAIGTPDQLPKRKKK